MKSTRIALLVLLALAVAAMSEVELLVSTYASENGRRLLAAGIPWYGIPLACIYIFIASVSLSYVR